METDATLEHPHYAVIEPVPTFDNATITDWAQRRLAPDAEAYSDDLGAFCRFVDTGHAHTVLEAEGGRAATEVHGARWVNVVLSHVKRALDGVYHSVKQHRYAGATWPRRRIVSTVGVPRIQVNHEALVQG